MLCAILWTAAALVRQEFEVSAEGQAEGQAEVSAEGQTEGSTTPYMTKGERARAELKKQQDAKNRELWEDRQNHGWREATWAGGPWHVVVEIAPPRHMVEQGKRRWVVWTVSREVQRKFDHAQVSCGEAYWQLDNGLWDLVRQVDLGYDPCPCGEDLLDAAGVERCLATKPRNVDLAESKGSLPSSEWSICLSLSQPAPGKYKPFRGFDFSSGMENLYLDANTVKHELSDESWPIIKDTTMRDRGRYVPVRADGSVRQSQEAPASDPYYAAQLAAERATQPFRGKWSTTWIKDHVDCPPAKESRASSVSRAVRDSLFGASQSMKHRPKPCGDDPRGRRCLVTSTGCACGEPEPGTTAIFCKNTLDLAWRPEIENPRNQHYFARQYNEDFLKYR